MKILRLLAAVAAASLSPGATAQPQSVNTPRPNILLIALDDVGFSDLGAFGSEIKTPHMDSIARGGLRFNHFGSKSICSSTRASLLTARNPHTVGMSDLASRKPVKDPADTGPSRGEIPANAQFLSQVLKRGGYSTFAVGKWHLSPDYETGEPDKRASWPLQRDFDKFYGFLSGWTDQYRPNLVEDNAKIATPVAPGYHFAQDITDRALANLKARDPSKPFFLYYAASIAHEPMQVPKPYIDAYNGVYDQGWDRLRAARFERMKQMGVIPKDTKLPPSNLGDPAWDTLSAEQKRVYARFMQAYAGFLTHGDEQIGRVLTYLRETGLDKNTLVVLISDNGAASEGIGHGGFRRPYFDTTPLSEMSAHLDELGSPSTVALYQRPWAMTGSAPFQRYKLYPYLGGVRTPLLVSWPGMIKDTGAVRSQHVDAVDIAPTIAEAVGLKFDDTVDGVKQIAVAGRSFLPAIKSAKAPSPRNVQYFELRGNRAISVDNWRAVAMHKPGTSFDTDDWKLYDLSKDFSESENLAARYPGQLAKMKAAWQQEAEKYGVLPLTEMSPLMQSRSFMKSEFAN